MSILARKTNILDLPIDEVYVLYGKPGSGKTTEAATFPKTPDAPMLYVDIIENGSASMEPKMASMIENVAIESFEELEELLTELYNGFYLDEHNVSRPIKFSTIVLDSLTQLEFLIKESLKRNSGKSEMNIKLWGANKDAQDMLYNMLRSLHLATGAKIVAIAHEKEISDEKNPQFGKIIPNLQTSAATLLCSKASYVWYCNVESEQQVNPDGTLGQRPVFYTYISTSPKLLTKCRKPASFQVPEKIENLTYDMFANGVLEPIRRMREDAKNPKPVTQPLPKVKKQPSTTTATAQQGDEQWD